MIFKSFRISFNLKPKKIGVTTVRNSKLLSHNDDFQNVSETITNRITTMYNYTCLYGEQLCC